MIPCADRYRRVTEAAQQAKQYDLFDKFCENPLCQWQVLPLPKEHYTAGNGQHFCDRLCAYEAEQIAANLL